ncbi:unnamed protein product, partial [marine sediment metagenome]
ITFNEYTNVAEISEILCKGCGTCVAACPSRAIIQNHFGDVQIFSMINSAIPKELKARGSED